MNWKSLAVLLVTLMLGFALGFVVSGQLSKHRVKRIAKGLHNPDLMANRWAKHLELTAAQKKEVLPIFKEYASEHTALHRSMRSRIDSLFEAMHSEMQPLLTPAQNKQLRRRHERRRRHGPPRPD